MKNKSPLLCAILFLFIACQNENIIENPDYEVKNAGIFTISRIEKGDSITKLWVQVNFTQGSWVRFREDQTFIRPSGTEEKFAAFAIENGEFDKELYMPESGDTLFIISFPGIDRNVKQIDFLHYESTLWGISFDGKKLKKYDVQNKRNEKRLKGLIKSDIRKEPDPENSIGFGGKARLAGYIKGYDPRINISGIIYAENVFSRKDTPYVIEPDSTGWFQIDLNLSAPAYFYMYLNDFRLSPYFEPGLTTALVLDVEECLFYNLYRNRGSDFKNTGFTGATGRLNNELRELEKFRIDWFDKEFNNVEEIKAYLAPVKDSIMQLLDETFEQKEYLPLTRQLTKNEINMQYGHYMLDKISDLGYIREGQTKYLVTTVSLDDRYNFLKELPDEPVATAMSSFSTFINRYEFCNIFSSSSKSFPYLPKIDDHFFEAGFAEKNPDLQNYKELIEELEKNDDKPSEMIIKLFEIWNSIQSKYPDILTRVEAYDQIKQWKLKVENLEKYGLLPGFFFQTALVRSMNYRFSDWDEATARIYTDYIKSNLLTYPLLLDEAESIYVNKFENPGFALSEGKAADLFRKIIEPYKGKIVMIDFWAVWCGPCLYGIQECKQEREKYKDSQDIAILYICGDSPQDRYEQLAQEHGLYNSILLSDIEYNYMRQLFQFNGIPRYVLIDKDGSVLTNNYNYSRFYNFDNNTSTIDVTKNMEKYIHK